MSDPKIDELARECEEEMYELVDDLWWPAEWPKAAAPIIKRHLLRAQAATFRHAARIAMLVGTVPTRFQEPIRDVLNSQAEWCETQAKEAADG